MSPSRVAFLYFVAPSRKASAGDCNGLTLCASPLCLAMMHLVSGARFSFSRSPWTIADRLLAYRTLIAESSRPNTLPRKNSTTLWPKLEMHLRIFADR
jgi:hypothetical protein